MKKININLSNSYDIIIDYNIDVKKYISNVYKNKNIFLITDDNIKCHEENLLNKLTDYEVKVIRIKASEENKSLITYNEIINQLIKNNITRDSLIIGLGGGVLGDIASFVASTILRGVKYISIPTTLLSQVDSSIGGKTALNVDSKKNIIGTFYQPTLVLIDISYLSTLSKEEYNNGLGEVIKCGIIKDKEILSLLKENSDIEKIIYQCLLVKKYFVEKDQYDLNERMILNFGHTFGHVIELEKNIKHGFAVIEGMLLVLQYGIDLNITNNEVLEVLINLLNDLDISFNNYNYKDYINKINYDKKCFEDYINFILIKELNITIIKQIKRK